LRGEDFSRISPVIYNFKLDARGEITALFQKQCKHRLFDTGAYWLLPRFDIDHGLDYHVRKQIYKCRTCQFRDYWHDRDIDL
ncbi:MAG: hypothetical protein AAF492_25910, partial [Verrucomicrobiota bacterium]